MELDHFNTGEAIEDIRSLSNVNQAFLSAGAEAQLKPANSLEIDLNMGLEPEFSNSQVLMKNFIPPPLLTNVREEDGRIATLNEHDGSNSWGEVSESFF